MNITTLVGRLTKDPELRYTPSGVATVRFTIAVNRQFKTEGQPEADFINCVAWRKTAENLANFQKKGNLIGVDGRIQTGSYEGQDGKRVYTTDVLAESIQFFDKREQGQQQQHQDSYQQQTVQQNNYQQQPMQQQINTIEVSSDDLPF